MTAIVFDLDGTLVDSAPDIRAAANAMLRDQGLAPLDLPTITSFIGNGLPKLVERVIRHTGLDMARHEELTQLTLDHYSRASCDLTAPYPGLREVLLQLREAGFALGICTNKPEAPARDILEALDLAGFFDAVIGGDTLPVRKPDPEPLNRTFDQLGRGAGIYVGDSEIDAETARRAGVPFLLFTEGYRKSPVEALPHHARFDRYADLPALIERVRAG